MTSRNQGENNQDGHTQKARQTTISGSPCFHALAISIIGGYSIFFDIEYNDRLQGFLQPYCTPSSQREGYCTRGTRCSISPPGGRSPGRHTGVSPWRFCRPGPSFPGGSLPQRIGNSENTWICESVCRGRGAQ